MENIKVYDKKDNIVIRKLKKALAIAALSIATLTACVSNKNNTTQKEPTGIETITPTDTIDPTETVTPTTGINPTDTPTPALQPKTLEEVKEDLKNVKVSVDDLMNEDVVYPTVFGAPDESFTNEALKRIAYFESRGMDFKTAKTLIAILNYCYLNSDAVDKEKADSYLSLINTDDKVQLVSILKTIIDPNVKNPDDQTVIGWGIIDQNDKIGRAVINNRQQQMTKLLMEKGSFDDLFIDYDNYDIPITSKDGGTIKLTGSFDDLDVSTKIMDTAMAYSSLEYSINTERYTEFPDLETIERFGAPLASIYMAFSDPEHANVRRHGFDAYDYFEEDLNKTSSYK